MSAPKGNTNRRNGLLLKNALNKALSRHQAHKNGRPASRSDAQKALEDIMYAVVCKAADGDQWAVDTLLDRAFGKPKQEIEQLGAAPVTGVEIRFVMPEMLPEKIVNGELVQEATEVKLLS